MRALYGITPNFSGIECSYSLNGYLRASTGRGLIDESVEAHKILIADRESFGAFRTKFKLRL